jgi:hypothetical protein
VPVRASNCFAVFRSRTHLRRSTPSFSTQHLLSGSVHRISSQP